MKKITHRDYIDGIRAKYEIAKEGHFASYLAKPSPALLNDYCKVIQQQELTKKDSDIIQGFYNQPNFDNDKFRPICNFFKGKTENPSHDILDIMALLVDFQPRPLGAFLKNNGDNIEIEKKESISQQKSNEVEIHNFAPSIIKKDKKNTSVAKMFTFFLLALIALSFFVYFQYYKTKDCMQWNGQEFVETNCNSETVGFGSFKNTIPYDEHLMRFRKIMPSDTTTYFKDGKAIVWYCKIDADHLELFNAPGHHPVTKQPLKAITEYMIKKYLK